jgi:hypothetical protein
MKVLDLQCGQHHVFEGWFGSEEDYQSQLARGLLTCPLCGDAQISKKLSAPRLNLHTARGERDASRADTASASKNTTASVPTPGAAPVHDEATANTPSPTLPSLQDVANIEPAQLQAALLNIARHVVANTEDVGDSFPEEARKMHYGETEARNIRGHATPEETEELIEEGIAVMPLPLPDVLKEPLQ